MCYLQELAPLKIRSHGASSNEMPYDERLSRWRADMDTITRNTATAWADTFLGDLLHKEGDNDEPHKM